MQEPLEIEYRALLPWVAAETKLRLPPPLCDDPQAWVWDAEQEELVGRVPGEDAEWRFHVALVVGRRRTHTAVMAVMDRSGSATWEAVIPALVVTEAAQAAGGDA